MRGVGFPRDTGSFPLNLRTRSRADRIRTSGPGFRAFQRIADQLCLTAAERITLLGRPSRTNYYSWVAKANCQRPMLLPLDILKRISAVIGIYSALSFLFEDEAQGRLWLRGTHKSPIFAGTSPLGRMLQGGLAGQMSVQSYLDAWRHGNLAPGAQGENFQPVTERDLIFV